MDTNFEKNTIKDIEAILNYLWKDEERHFYESECDADHIFPVLKRLQKTFDIVVQ
jgi:hypothetical protein